MSNQFGVKNEQSFCVLVFVVCYKFWVFVCLFVCFFQGLSV